jgi:hypothetical protein
MEAMEAEATGGEATGAGGMEAMGVNGMGATGGKALGWASASALDRSGGHTGVDTGDLMPIATPMRTRPSSRCHPPSSMCNPQHRPLPSPLLQSTGTIAMRPKPITPMFSSAQEDGDR